MESERFFALDPIYARPECGKSSSHVIGALATQANQSLTHIQSIPRAGNVKPMRSAERNVTTNSKGQKKLK